MIIVGEKEQANRTVSVSQRDDRSRQDMGEMQIGDFIGLLKHNDPVEV